MASMHEMTVKATGILTSRPVVSCANPADAASPVYLHRGEYRQQIGQAADYRHNIEAVAERHQAELVTGYHDGQQWRNTTTADEERVAALVQGWAKAEGERLAKETRSAAAAERSAEERLNRIGTEVQATLERHLGGPAGRMRWTDRLIADARLTAETVQAIREMASGSGTDYDCRTEEGTLYRVRIGWYLSGVVVVPLVAAE
jgi:hypothetical protein